jgi:predicted DNA-binding protein (UPF0251 family)
MPRRKRLRKVVAPPDFQGYKPYGQNHGRKETVELHYEEYEALKLADYDYMKHEEACKIMGISRPTFARIYESARRKIARALVETREIKAVYGHAYLDKSWLLCEDCQAKFTIPQGWKSKTCPLCKSSHIQPVNKQP